MLACILVSLRWKGALAHRELIDLVMILKESGKVTQLDEITKVGGLSADPSSNECVVLRGDLFESWLTNFLL